MSHSVVRHGRCDVGGIDTFYREAGAADAPVLLLPHGYPCSSYEFRNLMPLLADGWRLLAPDFPGCGYSATPDDFAYGFDGYADFLEAFLSAMSVDRFAIYLHDFGSQIGFRFAMRAPERVRGLIIQNGDIYEDALGPKYDSLLDHFRNPTDESRAELRDAVSEEGYREEFQNAVDDSVAQRIPPDLWTLHWSLTTERRREIYIGVIEGLKDNLAWFPRYQAYLRDHRPPTLIVWGPRDGYMPERSALAYRRDLPDAELHLIEDGGHWLLETHLDAVAPLIDGFLSRLDP